MTGFDHAVLAVIALSSVFGLWRGVVSEVLGLVAWVAAFFAARAWSQAAAEIRRDLETLRRFPLPPAVEPATVFKA